MHWKGSESQTKCAELMSQALRATSADEQQQKWNEVFDLVADELPLYPLFHRKAPTAWDGQTLVNFKPISVTGLYFSNVGTTK